MSWPARKTYVEVAQHCLQMSLLGMVMAIDAGMNEDDIRKLVGLCVPWFTIGA